ncbi:type 4a pilus biogenesis protein PilO [Desulfobacter latus]|uniref:Type 4a pilus biogenesis protein PilO n=1 Tax=Desulfobacter latus TaxID=2292 RepID=A0A850TDH4_9BACT|nr:type 4a pilus biogenesis protein PilO [Desulfobacter latus]NWH05486.1 type 4a pilus biogenesis protein PilO [Desulfobacter latus]
MAGKKKESITKIREKVDPVFEKIGELTKIQRLLICLGTLAVIGAGFYFFLLGPKLDTLTAAREDLERQKNLLSTYKIKAAALEKMEARMAQAREQFNIAMTALPDKRELPSLLDEISKAGSDAGLEVQLFAPKSMVKKNFYTEIPFSMTVAGRYHQVAEFFYRVAGLNRVVNISAININRVSGKESADRNKIQMKCTAVTYMFVEPKEDGGTGNKHKKRRKKR